MQGMTLHDIILETGLVLRHVWKGNRKRNSRGMDTRAQMQQCGGRGPSGPESSKRWESMRSLTASGFTLSKVGKYWVYLGDICKITQ